MSRKARQLKRLIRRPFEWAGIFLAQLIFAHVPHGVLFAICDAIAAVGYRFDRYGRELSRTNLRIVFHGRELPRRREELILRRSYRNMMRTLGHIFWTSRHAAQRARAVGEFSPESLDALARKSKGLRYPRISAAGRFSRSLSTLKDARSYPSQRTLARPQ